MLKHLLKRSPFVVIGIAIFLCFVFYSFLVHKDLFTSLDFNTTVRLQDHISRRFDVPFSFLSLIGEFQYVTIFLVIILLIYRKLRAVGVLLLFALFHVFELYGKIFVDHLPPPQFLLRTDVPGDFPQFYVRTQNSFPSGHAARALFVSLILAFLVTKSKRLNKTQKVFIYVFLTIYDIVMLTSRIYLGEHWATDVLGGSLLGASFALFGFLFL